MNHITVTLTEPQLLHLINLLWMDINPDIPQTNPGNAFTIRLANKLAKAYKTV